MPMINFKQYDGPSPVHSHLHNFRRWKLGLAKSACLVGILLLSVLIAQAGINLQSLAFSGADADTSFGLQQPMQSQSVRATSSRFPQTS